MSVKQHEKKHHENTHFLRKCSKSDLKMLPKMWLFIGENHNGVPRVAFFHLKWQKCSPCPPKVIPKNENGVKRGPEFWQKWWPRPGGLREALTMNSLNTWIHGGEHIHGGEPAYMVLSPHTWWPGQPAGQLWWRARVGGVDALNPDRWTCHNDTQRVRLMYFIRESYIYVVEIH